MLSGKADFGQPILGKVRRGLGWRASALHQVSDTDYRGASFGTVCCGRVQSAALGQAGVRGGASDFRVKLHQNNYYLLLNFLMVNESLKDLIAHSLFFDNLELISNNQTTVRLGHGRPG